MGKIKEPATAYKPALRPHHHQRRAASGGQSPSRWQAFFREGWQDEDGGSRLDLVRLVQEGLPLDAVETALEDGLITREELYDVVIPPRTLSHRKEKGQSLTPDESDKLMRLVRVKGRARDTFQNTEKAERWLNRPSRALRGETPIQLVRTESGARLVEDELHRIAWGLFV